MAVAASTALVRRSQRTISAHYWATALLVIALVPLLRAVGLPLKFSWTAYFVSYWLALPGSIHLRRLHSLCCWISLLGNACSDY